MNIPGFNAEASMYRASIPIKLRMALSQGA